MPNIPRKKHSHNRKDIIIGNFFCSQSTLGLRRTIPIDAAASSYVGASA